MPVSICDWLSALSENANVKEEIKNKRQVEQEAQNETDGNRKNGNFSDKGDA